MHIPSTSPKSGTAVLVLSSSDRIRATLLAILASSGWTVYEAATHAEAVALLDQLKIPVVIADGAWKEIIHAGSALHTQCSVIVTAAFADEALWAEVLNLGGYDVLSQPFDVNEVTRIAQAAYRRSNAPYFHPMYQPERAKAAI